MSKGISPLIASVLLIAITMAVAAILANFVSTWSQDQTRMLGSTCVGGSINYVSADYPKWDSGRITAVVEAQFTALGDFRFDVIFNNDTLIIYSPLSGSVTQLAPGVAGSITSEDIGGSSSDIKQVRISSNCSNVYTSWSALK